MKRRTAIRTLLIGGLFIAVLLLLWVRKKRSKPKTLPIAAEATPVPVVSAVVNGGGGGSGGGTTNVNPDTMSFTFTNMTQQVFTHNRGRYVITEVINEQGHNVGVSETQTLNTVTLAANQPISGTLIIY